MKAVKLEYQNLFHTNEQQLSPGKMLLMGFNGLFDKLDSEFNNLISILCNLEVPACWRKLDQVKDAKTLSALIFNTQIKEILSEIFFLKRLEAMSDFFALCVETCKSFKGVGNTISIINDEQLNKPIRKYTADFISKQFLGITTEAIAYIICFLLQNLGLDLIHEIDQKDIGAENKVPLDELCHKSYNEFLKNGIFTQNVLSQVSNLETNLKTAWEKMQEPKKLEQKLSMLQSSVVRLQNQMTLHNWIYDDILQISCNFTRTKFLIDLRNEIINLNVIQEQLKEKCEIQKNLIASVDQRLKWAAGANPDVNEVLSAFEIVVANRDKKLEIEQQIVNVISSTCHVIINHELLKTQCPETTSYDQQFLSNLDKFRKACHYSANLKLDTISIVEENIMHLYTPDLLNNPKWISVISEKISEIITTHQKQLTEEKCNVFAAQHSIASSLEKLKKSYAKHSKIMSDFKSLLKSMTKIDDYAHQTQQFIAKYRKFIENFDSVTSKFDEITVAGVREVLNNITYVEDNLDSLYDGLTDLKNAKIINDENSIVKMALVKQESMNKGQQKNIYAVNVWRRVRMKLEGRDPDPGRKYLTKEQVRIVFVETAFLM